MSAKPEAAEPAAAPAKSKMLLIIIVALVLVLILGGAGAFFLLKKSGQSEGEDAEEKTPAPKVESHAAPKVPPAYLPLDNMVVNLADPGGERVAQVGVTLEVIDVKSVEAVKAYLPVIRSGILLQISKRTAEEMLNPEGKEKLAESILREASIPFGGGEEEEDSGSSKKKKKRAQVQYPVIGVLFSSFIVQ